MKILLAVMCLLMSACTAGLGGAKITNLDALHTSSGKDDPYEMQGIFDSVKKCPKNSLKSCEINIFYIHGMGKTEEDFHKALFDFITDKGDFKPVHVDPEVTIITLPPKFSEFNIRGEADLSVGFCGGKNGCEFGEMFKNAYTGSHEGKPVNVRSYALYWHEDAWTRVQNEFMGTDIETIATDSVLVNRGLKEAVVDQGFSDAALYLSDFGEILRYATETAICHMIRDAALPDAGTQDTDKYCDLGSLSGDAAVIDKAALQDMNFTFVSKSLGSRILMDSLMPLNELNTYDAYAQALLRLNPKMDTTDILEKVKLMPDFAAEAQSVKTKRAIAGSVSRGYMLANQLPLLGLGNVKIASKKELELRDAIYCELILGTGSDVCQTPMFVPAAPVLLEPAGFFTFIETTRRKASPDKLNIYAFRDPNDILGFKAVNHIPDAAAGPYAKIEIAEIEHRNAREWLWLFANPLSAHANEDDRPQSLALIWCGGKAGPGGKLTASKCE